MSRYFSYLIIALNVMLILLAVFQEQVSMPHLLQAGGRLHPALLHLPIGFIILSAGLFLFRKRFDADTMFRLLNGVWHISAIAAVVSALAGIALSTEDGYDSTILYRHMNIGVALSILTGILATLWKSKKGETTGFRILLAATGICLILTGHNGAMVTHGENFLTEPFEKPLEAAINDDSITVFEAAVLPILDRKCNSCHNPGKKKGGLVMTTAALLSTGGENGAVWKPGEPDASTLYKHIMLPLEHDDHMPPAGKTQLTEPEKEIIRLFIARGADLKQRLAGLSAQDSLITLLANAGVKKKTSSTQVVRSFGPADPETIKELNIPTRTVTPLSLGDPGLSASFFLPGQFNVRLVTGLGPVSDNVIEINLSGMPVNEEVMDALSSFTNLEILNLNQTPVTDEWIRNLTSLQQLRTVSLTGTKTGIKGYSVLGSMKGLGEVYTWQSGLKQGEIEKLTNQFPHIRWDAGAETDGKEILRLTPPLLVNDNRILGPGEKIRLRHNLPGVEIRYTTASDGPDPDSVSGDVFTTPLEVKGSVRIRARAIKSGWRSSRLAEYSFFTAGLRPDTATLNTAPNKDYRASGAKTITDARGGDADNFRDGAWLGYRENPMVTTLGFNTPRELSAISLSYMKNIGSYIMPPAEVRVMAGNTAGQMKTLAVVRPRQPGGYDPNQIEAVVIPVTGKYSTWKITVTPVAKLPLWHGGKGSPGWVMVDEVYLYP